MHWRDLKFLAGVKQHGLFLWVPCKEGEERGMDTAELCHVHMMLGMMATKGDIVVTSGAGRTLGFRQGAAKVAVLRGSM